MKNENSHSDLWPEKKRVHPECKGFHAPGVAQVHHYTMHKEHRSFFMITVQRLTAKMTQHQVDSYDTTHPAPSHLPQIEPQVQVCLFAK